MTPETASRHRRSIRLKGHDYSQAGAYFVTLCTHGRACVFGEIVDGQMRLNDAGRIVADEWMKTAFIRNEIALDEWVVMPNHFHGIVWICRIDGVDDACCRGDRPVAPTTSPVVPWADIPWPGVPTRRSSGGQKRYNEKRSGFRYSDRMDHKGPRP
ncbi:MAG: hypothetical protein H5U10_11370 [Desulfacinum sp.]|nr:hypothetical protein [Desulfacinum sp.]